MSKILEEVAGVVAERGKAYGSPLVNFRRIADLWNAYISNRYADNGWRNCSMGCTTEVLNENDVAQLMILSKMARLMESPGHRDSVVDILGYGETLAQMHEELYSSGKVVIVDPRLDKKGETNAKKK